MAFQDFDQLKERRQLYRRQKIKRRIVIGTVVTLVVVVVAAVVGVVMCMHNQPESNSSKTKKGSDNDSPPDAPNPVQKEVKAVCTGTDYKMTCEDRLLKALGKNDSPTPQDIVRAAFVSPSDEIKEVVKKASEIKYDNALKRAAVEDCVELLNDALREFNESIAGAHGMDLAENSADMPDLNDRLSAALSHQETCVDGFPDGKEKDEMEKLLKDAKALSRNTFAIVSRMSLIVKGSNSQRKLLSPDGNGVPGRVSGANQRLPREDECKMSPNVTVAKDGSGKFDSISAALKAMPNTYTGRYVIYVKAGVYGENVVVDKKMANVTICGDRSEKTIVSGSKSYADGVTAFRSATFAVLGGGFMAKSIGFRNTAGPQKNQAVALRVQADHSIFVECRIEGYQNALFAQSHRQFYRSCEITGTIDIIFGDAAAVFQNCIIRVRKPLKNQSNTVTAQTRLDKRETTGIVIQNSHILADDDLEAEKQQFKSYLGRARKEYSRAVVMETQIGDLIQPEGWLEGKSGVKTVYCAEFENKGAGAKNAGRVKWPGFKVIGKEEAGNFRVGEFLQGESWIKGRGVPVRMGLYN